MSSAWRTAANVLVGPEFVRVPIRCAGIPKHRFLMPNGQLQLGFEHLLSNGPPRSRAQRSNRAHWWFGRMRKAVEQPFDWQSPLLSRRPRIWMPDEAEPPQVPG